MPDGSSAPTRRPRITVVAALDRRRAIGRGNDLPWRLPDDLRHFKALTSGATVLMGRRTAESLRRPLPDRRNLVLTSATVTPVEGMVVVDSVDAALTVTSGSELFVIGGARLYAAALPLADRMVLTEVDAEVDDADTWFPEWDRRCWQERSRTPHLADERHFAPFAYVEYARMPTE